MSDREIKPTVLIEDKPKTSALPKVLLVVACVLLLGAGLLLSFWNGGKTVSKPSTSTTEQPRGGVFSGGRQTPSSPGASAGDSGKPSAAQGGAQSAGQAASQSAAQSAAQAEFERQQHEQQIAAQRAELDRLSAEQAAAARRNQEEFARLQAERERMAAQQRAAASIPQNSQHQQQQQAQQVYDGPSSGAVVWEGDVQGVALVTIMGDQADQGRVVSGSLPGVSVSLQPKDGKHVIIAAPPSPSNRYKRLAFRVQGKGTVQQTILWTVN
jgi:flagellar basal body-associated protein FliL